MNPRRRDLDEQLPPSLISCQYRPRTVSFEACRSRGRWRVKINVVTVTGTASDHHDIVEAAWDTSASVLRQLPETDADTNVAFLTVHVGMERTRPGSARCGFMSTRTNAYVPTA